MTARLSSILDIIVSKNQYGFIKWRYIEDNIIMSHELVSRYHVDEGIPYSAKKAYLKNAYDSINWDYLEEVWSGLSFSHRFINWVRSIYYINVDEIHWTK